MYFMHEDLIHDHVQRVHDDFAPAHYTRDVRPARRRAGTRWSWRRAGQPSRSLTPVGAVAPVAPVEVAGTAIGRSGPLEHVPAT